jgi:hypothetical protein
MAYITFPIDRRATASTLAIFAEEAPMLGILLARMMPSSEMSTEYMLENLRPSMPSQTFWWLLRIPSEVTT